MKNGSARPSLRTHTQWRRAFDASMAAVGIVSLGPVILLLGFIVAIDTRSAPICWQARLGSQGRSFKYLKFCTMAAPYNDRGERRTDHERMSIIGRFLRRSGLDQLPQFYNVLVGEMSFFGPRPLFLVEEGQQPPNS